MRQPTALDKVFASFGLDTCQPGIDPLLGCELTDEIKAEALEELLRLRLNVCEAVDILKGLRHESDDCCEQGEIDSFLSTVDAREAGAAER